MIETSDDRFPQVARLLEVMARLRDPETGCPWDQQQTFETIVPHTIEEAYEVADAIAQGDMAEVKEELGDLLFQVVFYAQMGKEQSDFDFEAVAEVVADKLIARHPHVFAGGDTDDLDALNKQWEAAKQAERKAKGKDNDDSVLAHIPKGMAPLVKAAKIQKKCAKVGFDWTELPPVVDKIKEEIDEVMAEATAQQPDQQAIEDEIGDLLFAVVNLARHLKVEPEQAMIRANQKFEKRFRKLEQNIKASGSSVEQKSLDELEAVWQQVKTNN